MKELLNISLQVIAVDIFIGFGLYSIIHLLISVFKSDIPFLNKLDLNATRFIIFSGIVYFVLAMTLTILSIALGENSRWNGPYWWALFLQPLIWLAATQLLWIKRIRGMMVARFLIAVILIVSFERFVIIVTSLHRDYSDGLAGISTSMPPHYFVFGILLKIIIFSLLATLYGFVADKLTRAKT